MLAMSLKCQSEIVVFCASFATFGKMNHVCKNVDPWGHGPANNEEKCNCGAGGGA